MANKYLVALKCKYYEGGGHMILFSHEYVIKFKSCSKSNQDWCIINKSDLLKKIDDENGLVRAYIYSIEKDKALIGINDTGDHRISRFSVKRSELVRLVSKK